MLLENVKTLCSDRGVTLFAMEKELGIGNGTIAKWNSSDPRLGNVKKVADYEDHLFSVADRWKRQYQESGMPFPEFAKHMENVLTGYGWSNEEVDRMKERNNIAKQTQTM